MLLSATTELFGKPWEALSRTLPDVQLLTPNSPRHRMKATNDAKSYKQLFVESIEKNMVLA